MAAAPMRIAGDDKRALPVEFNFTEAKLRERKCPPGKPRIRLYDSQVKGLTCRITPAGGRAFYWYGRVKGLPKPLDFHLGDAGKITLRDARERAHGINAGAARGEDPRVEHLRRKTAAATAITVGQMWNRYKAERLEPHCSPATLRSDASRYKCHLAAWRDRLIQDIKPDDVVDFHRALSLNPDKGPNVADKTVKLLGRMLAFVKVRPNPAAGVVKFHGDEQRTRFLSQAELARLIAELDRCSNQTIADVLRFALLTGARRGNVCAARWSDVHTDRGLWIIPGDQSKNGEPMTIVLAPAAVDLIERRRATVAAWLERRRVRAKAAEPEACLYIFPGRTPDVPVHEIKTTWEKIRTAAGLRDVRMHDLRHTLASWMAMGGASLLQIGRQLGHADKRSTARYAHLELETVRPATDAAVAAMFSPGKKPAKPHQTRRKG